MRYRVKKGVGRWGAYFRPQVQYTLFPFWITLSDDKFLRMELEYNSHTDEASAWRVCKDHLAGDKSVRLGGGFYLLSLFFILTLPFSGMFAAFILKRIDPLLSEALKWLNSLIF